MANPIRAFLDYVPSVDESCFVDETSVVIGEVSLAEDVSIWPYACLLYTSPSPRDVEESRMPSSA